MQIKKYTALVLTIVLAFSLAACGSASGNQTQPNSAAAQDSTEEIKQNTEKTTAQEDAPAVDEPSGTSVAAEGDKVLILYFSANNTKDVDAVSSATPMADGMSSVEWIADIIHDTVGGDLVPIIPSEDYPLDYDELADYAKQEKNDAGRPAFEDLGIDPASYDTVFIGYPIWWYEMPMIMNTFFETYDLSGVTIIPFNTHAGSRDGGTYSDIQELEPNAVVLDGLAIPGEDAGMDSAKADVDAWLESLELD